MYKCGRHGKGNIEGVLRMMHEFGAQQVVDARDPIWSSSCLHSAAYHGHPNIITLLVENGAEIDPKDHYRETPLREAIRKRKYSSITLLIKLGASLEKAHESNWFQNWFDGNMTEQRTQDAINEGYRLAGE